MSSGRSGDVSFSLRRAPERGSAGPPREGEHDDEAAQAQGPRPGADGEDRRVLRHGTAGGGGRPGGPASTSVAGGYVLRGGLHPDTAAIANLLANTGTRTGDGDVLSEAAVLGAGGGLGAGYILWEFAAHDRRVVVLAFRNQWQYPDRWMAKVLGRLGLEHTFAETGGRQPRRGRPGRGARRRGAGHRVGGSGPARVPAPAGVAARVRGPAGRGRGPGP